jgi:hypothetical protein
MLLPHAAGQCDASAYCGSTMGKGVCGARQVSTAGLAGMVFGRRSRDSC